jgi:hypothetical protein
MNLLKLPLIKPLLDWPLYRGLAALLISLAVMLPQPALAIGPGTGGSKIRVSDQRLGPYILLVATSPLPVSVGQMSVWVRVTNGETNELRRDAVVIIEATAPGSGDTLTTQATHKNAGNDFDYVAHFEVQKTGQWQIKVTVQDELGQAEVSFSETVTQGVSFNVIVGLAIPFVILGVAIGIYLWRKSAA